MQPGMQTLSEGLHFQAIMNICENQVLSKQSELTV